MDIEGVVPNTTRFVNGTAVDIPGSNCAGLDSNFDGPNVTLCQSLSFAASVGNMDFFIGIVPIAQALTWPAIFLFLQLPFLWYALTLVAPLVGIVYQFVAIENELALATQVAKQILVQFASDQKIDSMWSTGVFLWIFTVLVYGACLYSAYSNDRHKLSLQEMEATAHQQRRNRGKSVQPTAYVFFAELVF